MAGRVALRGTTSQRQACHMRTFQLLDTTLSLFSTAMRPGSYRRRPRLSREDLTHWAVKWLALLQDMGF